MVYLFRLPCRVFIIIFQDCKTGDLVVITKLVKLEKKEITHTVTERVFR